jgi:hypothetical protein
MGDEFLSRERRGEPSFWSKGKRGGWSSKTKTSRERTLDPIESICTKDTNEE